MDETGIFREGGQDFLPAVGNNQMDYVNRAIDPIVQRLGIKYQIHGNRSVTFEKDGEIVKLNWAQVRKTFLEDTAGKKKYRIRGIAKASRTFENMLVKAFNGTKTAPLSPIIKPESDAGSSTFVSLDKSFNGETLNDILDSIREGNEFARITKTSPTKYVAEILKLIKDKDLSAKRRYEIIADAKRVQGMSAAEREHLLAETVREVLQKKGDMAYDEDETTKSQVVSQRVAMRKLLKKLR